MQRSSSPRRTGGVARVAAGIAAAALGVLVLGVPASASAGVVTNITFAQPDPVAVDFGAEWNIVLVVGSEYDGGPNLRLTPTDGTVDVFLSGIGGPYASALPIQPDGTVYFSQPSAKPLLAAGDYDVSAIFNPAPGGYYSTSQTASPRKLSIKALGVSPKVEILTVAAVSKYPVITATLTGAYVDAKDGAPAGTWNFVVSGANGKEVFGTDAPQLQGATDPVRVEITTKLPRGMQYTVASTFTPAAELADGLTVAGVPEANFQTPGGTLGESLGASIPLPLWLIIVLGVLLVGLAVAAIILGARIPGRVPNTPAPTDGERHVPGDPTNVELVRLEDLGLPEPTTIPEMLPPGEPTMRIPQLPESTTWLLSDVEPSVNAPVMDPANAPTERIGTLDDLAEPPTERTSAAVSDESEQRGKPSGA